MNKKSILVLATLDERGQGHGWSQYQLLKGLGYHTEFVCLVRQYKETQKYIIDATSKYNIKYLLYRLIRDVSQLLFAPYGNMRWFYKGFDFASAKDVLERVQIKPNYILLCSHQFFLSPKEIYQLQKQTGATIIFKMVDEKLLGGGCPYPMDCVEYEKGCQKCSLYHYAKFIPRNVVKQKEKYFSKMPFHLVGTAYDLSKALKVSYLKNKQMHKNVYVPDIPFRKDKSEARKKFNIDATDFLIFAGAVNVKNPSKGFKELEQSLNIFSEQIKEERPVTLLLLGNNIPNLNIPKNLKVCAPGFLDLEGLFTAYYACDIYISPSIYDAGPMMVNYSLACGRPVIAFPVGIALDLVVHKKTGWIAKWRDSNELADGVSFFYDMPAIEMSNIAQNCLNHIESFRNKQWYKEILA